jgi:hypothetical protein
MASQFGSPQMPEVDSHRKAVHLTPTCVHSWTPELLTPEAPKRMTIKKLLQHWKPREEQARHQ